MLGSFLTTQKILEYTSMGIVILFCLPVHEMAHGWVASLFGDETAKKAGRLTLDPRAHIDITGLFAFILIGIGWAKPVPINSNNFKNQRGGLFCVALAGPLSNFILSFVFLFLAVLSQSQDNLSYILQSVAISNLWLGLFNLVPIPPLDGGRIVTSLLPMKISYKVSLFLQKYQGVVTVVVLVLFYLGILQKPLEILLFKIYYFLVPIAVNLASIFL